ncbi:hypothetical protein B0T14DRAFT_482668 [Immersiella caudata]|uniref:Uncharacterized protein n=1 Tax=Immersiella caudata TaxID=314043 RepID=A0AA40BWL3_9PEZI|nr:hypothetical protein B0T14DRAFT_482668 [Immersiella caudata]
MTRLYLPPFVNAIRSLVAASHSLRQPRKHPDTSSPVIVVEKSADISLDGVPTAEFCAIHLQLLELFADLRGRVEEWGRNSGMGAEEVWETFVKLAVARFTCWFQHASRSTIEMETSVPPLDVLMAWHSFMLNPHAYQVFSKAARSDGAGNEGILWPELQRSISPDGEGGGSLRWKLSGRDVEAADRLGLHADMLGFLMETLEASKCDTLVDSLSELCRDSLGRETKLQKLLETYHELSQTGFAYRNLGLDFDLASAVQRQTVFALKMTRFGWHHSPFCAAAIEQARERYRCFFSLIPSLPAGENAVPTLDIDLVWHTHQLSPAEYANFSKAMTGGRFVNHNDTITEEVASSGSKNTGTRYREQFGEVYSICLSWYCQAARLAPDKRLSRADIEQIRDAIASERRRRKLDLASCRCNETVVLTGLFGAGGVGECAPPVDTCGSGCGGGGGGECAAPNASCDGNCGGCGGCGG